jgi:hypothetical protein
MVTRWSWFELVPQEAGDPSTNHRCGFAFVPRLRATGPVSAESDAGWGDDKVPSE